jgi:hypothetical protein
MKINNNKLKLNKKIIKKNDSHSFSFNKKLKLNKKGEMPFWLVSMIIILATMIVILIIISISGGRLNEFTEWLERIF